MKPIRIKGQDWECLLAEKWPPDPDGEASEAAFTSFKVWKTVCGQTRMGHRACVFCPNLIVDGEQQTPTRQLAKP